MQFSLFSHLFMLLSLFPFYAYFALPRPVGFGILTVCIAAPLVQQLVISGGKPWDSTSVGFLTYRILTVIFFYGLAWLLDAEKKRSEENRRLLRRLRASDSRLREYADRVAGTVALEERTRLARDIHDSLGHALTAIKIQLSKAVAYHDVDLDESFAAVNAARETADDAMKDIRESLGRLNGEAAAITLAEGLPRLVNRLDDSGVEVQYRYQGSEEGYNYSVLMGLYRFVQEGVTNILKHASASRASLIVEFGPAEATAELNDNGTGFNPAEPESDPVTDHYGLRGLRRRLELVRGTMEVVSKPGEGTRLFARVPKDPVATDRKRRRLMASLRVLVVDDQHLVREGIASLLALQDDIDVVGSAENGRDALLKVGELRPDVVLLDIRMPVLDGIAAAKRLHEDYPDIRVMMLTTFDDEEYIVKSLKAGAVGYLMKDIPIDELTNAVRAAAGGAGVMARGILGTIVGRLGSKEIDDKPGPDPGTRALLESLSIREQDILRCLARGDTNREIAETVNLSEGTVKNYISGILTSLDLRDRTQAALFALKNGWVRD